MSSPPFLVNPASDNGATGKRWPELAHRAAALGLAGETLLSERPGHLIELAERAARDGAELVVAVGGDGTLNEVVNGCSGPAADRARDDPDRHGPRLRAHVRDPGELRRRGADRARRKDAHDRRRPRHVPRRDGGEAERYFVNVAASA